MAGTRTWRASGPRGPTNTWDAEQRMALHVLYSHFNLDAAIRARIFNTIFHEHLLRRGIPDGLSPAVLDAQYRERKKRTPTWDGICAEPSTDEQWQTRHALIRQLRAMIATPPTDQGAAVHDDDPATLNLPVQRTRPMRHRSNEDVEEPRTPVKRLAHFTLGSDTSKKQKATHGSASRVVASSSATPRTTKSNKKDASRLGKMKLTRYHGPTLWLTPEQMAQARLPLLPVPKALAGWNQTGLFFRYFDSNSYGKNGADIFAASRFLQNNVIEPAPKSTELRFEDVENHIMANKSHSPFVSFSNSLLWLLRKALKKRREGAVGGKIALINVSALDRSGVYHLLPFWTQLVKRFPFIGGKWRYRGKHEFLVWAQVTQPAIVHTFSVDELIDACETIPSLQRLLRLDTIVMPMDLETKVRPLLRQADIPLDNETAVAIAKVCRVLGLTGSSCLDHLAHVVSDVVQGWCMTVKLKSAEEWASTAAVWVKTLCGRSTLPTLERDLQLRMTWLNGVKAAMGPSNSFRSDSDPESVRKLERNARAVGLESPARILLDPIAKATAAVLSLQQEVDAHYGGARTSTRLLPAATVPNRMERDVNSGHGANRASKSDATTDDDDIMYDEDVVGL
ncbi:hypothetical protein LTR53_008101 [Teratosphaeriaceae sp. CCFEE 6253]|nr:hypothetical protein LTR53_008101 [Teratosphaeriaceae sp. CCFEE 6253]